MNSGAGFRSLDDFEAAFVEEGEQEHKATTRAQAARTREIRPLIELTNLSVSLDQISLALRAGLKIGLEPAGAALAPPNR